MMLLHSTDGDAVALCAHVSLNIEVIGVINGGARGTGIPTFWTGVLYPYFSGHR